MVRPSLPIFAFQFLVVAALGPGHSLRIIFASLMRPVHRVGADHTDADRVTNTQLGLQPLEVLSCGAVETAYIEGKFLLDGLPVGTLLRRPAHPCQYGGDYAEIVKPAVQIASPFTRYLE